MVVLWIGLPRAEALELAAQSKQLTCMRWSSELCPTLRARCVLHLSICNIWAEPWGMTVVSKLPSSQHEENDRTVILKNWTVSVPGREAFERVHGSLRIGAGFCTKQ